MTKKALVSLSGGLDSTTTLAIAKSKNFEPYVITFDYDQKNDIEVEAAKTITNEMNVESHKIFPIRLSEIGGSALTDDIEVPKDQQKNKGIPVTYVAGRNIIFLSLAVSWAEVNDIQDIFIGVNSVDYSGYPDCRPEFIEAFQKAINLGTKSGVSGDEFTLHTPIIDLTKAEIIQTGTELGVDYSQTISCYDPDSRGRACGKCDSCRMRKKGFIKAGIKDPTRYQEGVKYD